MKKQNTPFLAHPAGETNTTSKIMPRHMQAALCCCMCAC